MKGFVVTPYQMAEIEPSEMDRLIGSGGDSQEWPLRFDRKKRIWPPKDERGQDWNAFYYEDNAA